MSRRLLGICVCALLALVMVQAVFLVQFYRESHPASVMFDADNLGIKLGPKDVRINVTAAGDAGTLVVAGGAGERLQLEPGRYDARIDFLKAADRQTQSVSGFEVSPGEQARFRVTFRSGELGFAALPDAVAGDVIAYVYRHDTREPILAALRTGQTALVVPGEYDVRAVLTRDTQEKVVRWERKVAVREGLQSRVNVPFGVGRLLVSANNAGMPLPAGAATLTVHRSGDPLLEVVETGVNEVAMVLEAGEFDIKARYGASADGPVRWSRGVEVKPDPTATTRVAVEFDSGTIAVAAKLGQQESLDDYQVYVYYYRKGHYRTAVAYAPAPAPVTLAAGLYDVRAHLFRSADQPDVWLRDIRVEAGAVSSHTVSFDAGRLLVRAYGGDGQELVGDQVIIQVFSPGNRQSPIATGRSGEELLLTAGRYDVVALDSRQGGRSELIEGVELAAAETLEKLISFP